MSPSATGPGRQAGFTLVELLVVVLIIGLLAAVAVPMYQDAIRRSRSATLRADARELYSALTSYHADHGAYPSEDEFDVETLAPLTGQGYLRDARGLTAKLLDGRILFYATPDVGGADQQLILVMRLAADPSIIGAVVNTNIIAAAGGWVDGVYIISDNDLAEAEL